MFWTCPRTWYYKYILKKPVVEDLKYAHRGNVVHYTLEKYYPNKKMEMDDVKKYFEKQWDYFELDKTSLASKKEETWNMILNAIKLDVTATKVEEKIFFEDVTAFIDVVDGKNLHLIDWKTSTRSVYNEKEYIMQLKYYAWLYKRKHGVKPKKLSVLYLKYLGDRSFLSVEPTDKDLENAKEWHFKTLEKMRFFINNPHKLPSFNKNYFFSPYKHLWDDDTTIINPNILTVELEQHGWDIYIKSKVDEDVVDFIDEKFSYEPKSAYFVKQKYPNANTTVKLFNKKYKRFPAGLKYNFAKIFDEYCLQKALTPNIKFTDKRYYNKKKVWMPDVIEGVNFRNYQQQSKIKVVEDFVSNNDCGILQLGTGAGKTLITAELIRHFQCKTLFLVDSKDLLYQTKKVFEKTLKQDIGIIGDSKFAIKDVTVAIVFSITSKLDQLKEYLGDIRFCVFDEAHKVASSSYQKVSKYLANTQYRLGLTATAKRDDGMDLSVNAIVGRPILSVGGKFLVDQGYLVKPSIYFIKGFEDSEKQKSYVLKSKKGDVNETPDYHSFYKNLIVGNSERNAVIEKIVKKHEGEAILIVVKSVDHGEYLESVLDNALYLHGSVGGVFRKKLLKDFESGEQKVLIATISIFSEGIDIPRLKVIINAASNKGKVKTVQLLGRCLRLSPDKNGALYYDFMDSGHFFYKASYDRYKALKDQGHKVNFLEYDNI